MKLQESYTIPKDKRFPPFIKEKPKKSLGMDDPFSTIGTLPSYILKRIQNQKLAKSKRFKDGQASKTEADTE